MAVYQNISNSTKRFYGVEFKPTEIHRVPGPINQCGMIRVPDSLLAQKETPVATAPVKSEKKQSNSKKDRAKEEQ